MHLMIKTALKTEIGLTVYKLLVLLIYIHRTALEFLIIFILYFFVS